VPLPHLKGDNRLIALKMGLKCPPMPIASAEEIAMFTKFMSKKPKPNDKHWRELARMCKRKTDGKVFFPKLPSVLKSCYKKWKKNQLIKEAIRSMGDDYGGLLKKLSHQRIEANPADNNVADANTATAAATAATTAIENETATMLDDDVDVTPEPPEHQVVNYVAPIAAPHQQQYVPAPRGEEGGGDNCYYFPYCKAGGQNFCGGKHKGSCKYFKAGDFKNIPDLDKKLEAKKREARTARQRERRLKRKREKTN